MTATAPALMTVDEFLELPDNGRERFLIRGLLYEKRMTYRNPFHSAVLMKIGQILMNWLEAQSQIQARVVGGEAGFRLRPEPASLVGVDVAVVARDAPFYSHGKRVVIDGPPLLGIEILSPSDRQDEIDTKVEEYLASGTPLVWIVNPRLRTVTAYQADRTPLLFAGDAALSAEPVLPGFRVPVSRVFETM
jgi:Uma2 family endonuclease